LIHFYKRFINKNKQAPGSVRHGSISSTVGQLD
jgi:hypothetical protein